MQAWKLAGRRMKPYPDGIRFDPFDRPVLYVDRPRTLIWSYLDWKRIFRFGCLSWNANVDPAGVVDENEMHRVIKKIRKI